MRGACFYALSHLDHRFWNNDKIQNSRRGACGRNLYSLPDKLITHIYSPLASLTQVGGIPYDYDALGSTIHVLLCPGRQWQEVPVYSPSEVSSSVTVLLLPAIEYNGILNTQGGISQHAIDLIKGLKSDDLRSRRTTFENIRSNHWFQGVDWSSVDSLTASAPVSARYCPLLIMPVVVSGCSPSA